MYLVQSVSIDEAYVEIIDHLLSPSITSDVNVEKRRGDRWMAEEAIVWELSDPRARVVTNPGRKLSPHFLAGEFFWIMSGSDLVSEIAPFNYAMKKFSDNGKHLFGAYGARLSTQIKAVKKLLAEEPKTRQAVLHIGRESDINMPTKDYPCNQLLQFSVNEYDDGQYLNLAVYVRSQDMLLGFPYDVFHWTMLQESLAKELGFKLGVYRHYMDNCHIYLDNEEKLTDIVAGWADTEVIPMSPLFQPLNSDHIITFKAILEGENDYIPYSDPTFGPMLMICKNKINQQNYAPTVMDLALHKIVNQWGKY